MTSTRQLLLASAAIAAIGVLGITLAMREHSHRHHAPVEGLPDEDTSAPLRGTDWNGPVGLPEPTETAAPTATEPSPEPTASGPHMPTMNDPVPPLSAIPAPTIAPPLDETLASSQRARAIEMMQQHVDLLEKEAAAAEAKGDTAEAAATRVRIERMKGRIAAEQDAGT